MRFDELLRDWDTRRRDREAFHDLMRYRVSEILLVGSLYDSFVVESDGFLTEQITGEYSKLNLSTIPRVTSAYTDESALARLSSGECDLVIIMAGLDFDRPLRLAVEMRKRSPVMPILLLVLNNSSLAAMDGGRPELGSIDRTFVWNGYSKLLVGMIKYVEDRGNVEADVATGLVRVILIIEDSVRYYSRYLPLVYTVLLRQTQELIEEERGVETYRLLRARTRPKILLASTFEEAESVFARFEGSILAVITDLRFLHRGVLDPEAGFDFVAMARSRRPDLPVLIQSSEEGVRSRAEGLGASFVQKSSESLAHELGGFIRRSLGFGEFKFLGPDGELLASAATTGEFSKRVAEVPPDCLLRHASRNEFSTWLTARGEYSFAALLRDYTVEDFSTPEDLRAFLLHVLEDVRLEKSEGLLPDFDEAIFRDDFAIARLGGGSVGGKGRGLEFLSRLVRDELARPSHEEWFIGMPRTVFVGIDEFEDFLERNALWSAAYYEAPSPELRERFAVAEFNPDFVDRINRYLQVSHRPLVVRSSGLLEDMVRLPCAGLYATRFLPNRGDPAVRLEALLRALREVWGSLFSAQARRHFSAIGYSLEEERMGVIIQELVGRERNGLFFPLASGLAWSGNPLAGPSGRGPSLALVPGLGIGASNFGPALELHPAVDEILDLPNSGPWARRTYGLPLADSRPSSERELAIVGQELEAASGMGRLWRRLQGSGALSAFIHLLGVTSRSFGDEAVAEFAIDETPLDRRPFISVVQIRPWHRSDGIKNIASEMASHPYPLVLPFRGVEVYGGRTAPCIKDILLIDSWTSSPQSAVEMLRRIDRTACGEDGGWMLILPDASEDGENAYEGLAWADLARAIAVVQPDARWSRPPHAAHLFFNVLAAGAAWIRIREGLPETLALLDSIDGRKESGPGFRHYRFDEERRLEIQSPPSPSALV